MRRPMLWGEARDEVETSAVEFHAWIDVETAHEDIIRLAILNCEGHRLGIARIDAVDIARDLIGGRNPVGKGGIGDILAAAANRRTKRSLRMPDVQHTVPATGVVEAVRKAYRVHAA